MTALAQVHPERPMAAAVAPASPAWLLTCRPNRDYASSDRLRSGATAAMRSALAKLYDEAPHWNFCEDVRTVCPWVEQCTTDDVSAVVANTVMYHFNTRKQWTGTSTAGWPSLLWPESKWAQQSWQVGYSPSSARRPALRDGALEVRDLDTLLDHELTRLHKAGAVEHVKRPPELHYYYQTRSRAKRAWHKREHDTGEADWALTLPSGSMVYVEVKKSDARCTHAQVFWLHECAADHTVLVARGRAGVDAVIEGLSEQRWR